MRHFGIVLCAGLALAGSVFAAWPVKADPVTIRTAPHRGYGRVVFNWPAAVPYTAESDGTQVTIRFGRTIESDVGSAVRTLGGYLRNAEIQPDGQTVRFTTAKEFGVRAFDLGNAIVVDLLDETAVPPAPRPAAGTASASAPRAERPAQPAAQPAEGPRLGVRTGEHEGYTRVVFDWPRNVDYSVDRSGGQVVLDFGRVAQPDLRRIQARPPKFIGKVGSAVKDGRLQVSLEIPETSRLRHFRSGSKVALDVMAPSSGEAPAQPKAAPAARTAEKTAPRTLEPAPVAEAAKSAPREPVSPEPTSREAASRPVPLVPGQQAGLTPPAQPAPVAQTRAQTPVETRAEAPAGPAPAGPSVSEAGPSEAPAGAVTLRFNWSEPVAAAVFRRAGYLWVVFDKPRTVDIGALLTAAGNVIEDLQQIQAENGTVLRVKTLPEVNPGLRRDGLAWLLDFKQQPLRPKEPIEIQAQPNSPAGARLFLAVAQPGAPVAIPDPEVGDNLIVIPVIPLGYGMPDLREYPQFTLLPTGQGAVIRTAIDTLRVKQLRQGIELTSNEPLQISAVPDDAVPGQMAEAKPLTRIMNLENLVAADPNAYREHRRDLMEAAALADGIARELARMDVARFYLANGFDAEALGVLRAMEHDRKNVQNDPEYRALRGAANFLLGRDKEASDDWNSPILDGNDEATLWRSALTARNGGAIEAAADLRRTSPILQDYPRVLQMPLGLITADAAVDVGDLRLGSQVLDLLRKDEPTPAEDTQIAYEEGRLLELAGDFDGAVVKWEAVEASPHRPSRAKAVVARTEMLLKLDRIVPADAIEEYERLRYAWRGDDFEFNLLRRLGQLYLAEQDYRNGLRTLRQLVSHFREHKDAQFVTQEMADAFSTLYLGGAADVLPPVTAIALYDEFRELTPPGEKGEEMVRKLADRLVAVDLLDRAGKLLEEQIEFRLKGTDKARVGAQLALIRIMANEPDQALKALEDSNSPGLPEDLLTKRRHLRARALMDQAKSDVALQLLQHDESIDAQRLRAEIFWDAQDWPRAAQVFGRLIRADGARPQSGLSEKQALSVLNYAIALTLSDNERGVRRVRDDYGTPMEGTTYRDAFQLITAQKTADAVNARDVAAKVQDAENFQSFLTEYRDRLKTQTLSELFSAPTPADPELGAAPEASAETAPEASAGGV